MRIRGDRTQSTLVLPPEARAGLTLGPYEAVRVLVRAPRTWVLWAELEGASRVLQWLHLRKPQSESGRAAQMATLEAELSAYRAGAHRFSPESHRFIEVADGGWGVAVEYALDESLIGLLVSQRQFETPEALVSGTLAISHTLARLHRAGLLCPHLSQELVLVDGLASTVFGVPFSTANDELADEQPRGFRAPEEAGSDANFTVRGDIWRLGRVAQLMAAKLEQIPSRFKNLIKWMIDEDPAKRPANATEVALECTSILEAENVDRPSSMVRPRAVSAIARFDVDEAQAHLRRALYGSRKPTPKNTGPTIRSSAGPVHAAAEPSDWALAFDPAQLEHLTGLISEEIRVRGLRFEWCGDTIQLYATDGAQLERLEVPHLVAGLQTQPDGRWRKLLAERFIQVLGELGDTINPYGVAVVKPVPSADGAEAASPAGAEPEVPEDLLATIADAPLSSMIDTADTLDAPRAVLFGEPAPGIETLPIPAADEAAADEAAADEAAADEAAADEVGADEAAAAELVAAIPEPRQISEEEPVLEPIGANGTDTLPTPSAEPVALVVRATIEGNPPADVPLPVVSKGRVTRPRAPIIASKRPASVPLAAEVEFFAPPAPPPRRTGALIRRILIAAALGATIAFASATAFKPSERAPRPEAIVTASRSSLITCRHRGALVVSASDGRLLGAPPLRFALPQGRTLDLLITAPGRLPKKVTIADGENQRIKLKRRSKKSKSCEIPYTGASPRELVGVGEGLAIRTQLAVSGAAVLRTRPGGRRSGAWLLQCADDEESLLRLEPQPVQSTILRIDSSDKNVKVEGYGKGSVHAVAGTLAKVEVEGDEHPLWVMVQGPTKLTP